MRHALVVVALGLGFVGCGDNIEEAEETRLLEPPAEGEGIQLRMNTTIAPGEETERCQFWVTPEPGINVYKQEIKFTSGSHHVLLFTTSYTSIPKVNRRGESVDTNGVVDCPNGAAADWNVVSVAGGSQKFDGAPGIDDLPDDVAVVIPGKTVLIINTHYLNGSDEPLDTEAAINLYTRPSAQVKREAGFLFFYNPFIRVPGQAQASARMLCPIRADMNLVNAQSHMHKRGNGYEANLVDATGTNVTQLYTTNSWDEVEVRRMSPHQQLKAGQMVDFRCDYANQEGRVVTQGLKTSDEMCMFVGLAYPFDRATEFCSLDGTFATRSLGGVWVGSGTATCLQTAGCVGAAKNPAEDGGDSLYGCIVNSCPKAATATSNTVRCQLTRGYGQCAATCASTPSTCGACVQQKCQAELGACSVATCN